MNAFTYAPGATPLHPDEADGLRMPHITMQRELNRWEQDNINDAVNWTRRMRRSDILTEAFLCTLHEKMYGKVWQWAGAFRKTDKNIGGQWSRVPSELRQLLDDVTYWQAHDTYPVDEIAARFHHRLVLIHLFPNGNGRHARLATDLLLVKVLKALPFSWGQGNLVEAGETRRQYIQALKAADNHDYTGLLAFVRS